MKPGDQGREKHAQRRFLTILFADISGSTRLSAALEAEQYAEILDAFRRLCRDVIARHGGKIVQLLGDGVLALFGYPDVNENDGRRATECALDLHLGAKRLLTSLAADRRVAEELPQGLGLHSGIHSGLVLFGDGDAELGRFELLGTVPNIAARLASAAARDEILVSAETLGPESYFFETSELRHVNLKGMAAPLAIYRVFARGSVQTRYQASMHRGLVSFVGRQAELALLGVHLRDASEEGRARCVAIRGPAGVGKTRLAEEFLAQARALNWQTHAGYCENYLSAEPLQPFLHVLRSLLELHHPDTPARAAAAVAHFLSIHPQLANHEAQLLHLLSYGKENERASADGAVAALTAMFTSLAARASVVLFIDDWQWADAATRLVLRAIGDIKSRPILLLLSTREHATDDPDLRPAHIIELAPFTRPETQETVARILPGIDPFVAEEIYGYSGGNPLFIEELCHSTQLDGTGDRLRAIHVGAAWLDKLIESRLASLPHEQAELVRAAAMIGNTIPGWLLESITGYAVTHPLVQGLAALDFVFAGEKPDTLRFKHGITRDAVYKAVGLTPRRAMHRRIAQSLQERARDASEEELYEALAYHYAAAEEYADAARYAELAGDKAKAASALDRAQAQYRAAMEAVDRLPPSAQREQSWLRLVQRFGHACVFDPAREPLDILHRAVERATLHNDLAALAATEYWLGYLNYGLGESRAAIHHCERALAAATRLEDPPLIVQIRAALGQALAAACDYDRAVPLLDEAIEIKRRYRHGGRPAVGLSYTLTCKAALLGDRGEFVLANECFEEALEAVRGADNEVEGSLFCWRSAVHLWQGRWDDARQCALHAQCVAERVKSLYLLAMGRALAAYAQWVETRAPAALQVLFDSTGWLDSRHREQYISLNYGWLAQALSDCGRVAEAREQTARALKRGRIRDLLGQPMACRAMARRAAEIRSDSAQFRYLSLALSAARVRQSRHELASTLLCQGQMLAAAGDPAGASEVLHEAAAEFAAMQMNWHLEQAALVLRQI